MDQKILKRLSVRESRAHRTEHLLILVYLIWMVVMEMKTKEVISPLCSMLAFTFMAHRLQPKEVTLWSLPFVAVSSLFLFQWAAVSHTGHITPYIRIGTLLLGASGSIMLSINRAKVTESFEQTLTILEKLPAPVVLSDTSGCIVFMNDDALRFLGISSEEAVGSSYFTYLEEGDRGKTVQQYMDMVDSKQVQLGNVQMRVKTPMARTVQGSIVSIQANRTKLLATVLKPDFVHWPALESMEG